MSDDLPFQTHSDSSHAGARRPSSPRATAQEKWVYETLQQYTPTKHFGLADFQMWRLVEGSELFEQLSSVRRARIGLLWVSRSIGATPYHPVEDSGKRVIDRTTDVACVVWHIKPLYRGMPYETWVARYKALARQKPSRFWNEPDEPDEPDEP